MPNTCRTPSASRHSTKTSDALRAATSLKLPRWPLAQALCAAAARLPFGGGENRIRQERKRSHRVSGPWRWTTRRRVRADVDIARRAPLDRPAGGALLQPPGELLAVN